MTHEVKLLSRDNNLKNEDLKSRRQFMPLRSNIQLRIFLFVIRCITLLFLCGVGLFLWQCWCLGQKYGGV
jgi:hypothetical protein